jgi:hypothetical protein
MSRTVRFKGIMPGLWQTASFARTVIRVRLILACALAVVAAERCGKPAPQSPDIPAAAQGQSDSAAVNAVVAATAASKPMLDSLFHLSASPSTDAVAAILNSVNGVSVVCVDSARNVIAQVGDSGPLIIVPTAGKAYLADTTGGTSFVDTSSGVSMPDSTIDTASGGGIPGLDSLPTLPPIPGMGKIPGAGRSGAFAKPLYNAPLSGKILMLTFFDFQACGISNDWTDEFANMVTKADNGYTLTRGKPTLSALRSVQNVDVFILTTHGDPTGNKYGAYSLYPKWPRFCATTSDLASSTPPDSGTLGSDLRDFRVVCIWEAYKERDGATAIFGGFEHQWYYAITERFVDAYIRFNKKSLVILNTCHSATESATNFVNNLHKWNASYVCGWTEASRLVDHGKVTNKLFRHLFGEMNLGAANPMRPFPVDSVYEWMDAHGELRSPNGGPNPAHFNRIVDNSPGAAARFEILAPSIGGLKVNEYRGELTITGFFSGTPSDMTASIGGTALTLDPSRCSSDSLVCVLGPSAEGDVQVSYSGHKSNTVQLTSWKGNFVYTFKGPDNMLQQVTMNLHFRSDVNSYRKYIWNDYLSDPRPAFDPDTDSKATYSSSGSMAGTDGSLTYSGSGNVSNPYKGSTNVFSIWALPAYDDYRGGNWKQLALYGKLSVSPGTHVTQVSAGTTTSYDMVIGFDPSIQDMQHPQTDFSDLLSRPDRFGTFPFTKKLRLGSDYGILGDAINTTVSSDPLVTAELRWSAIAATSPPDPKGGR